MITALYKWAKYVAKKDNVNIEPQNFNTIIEKVVNNTASFGEMDMVYQYISHLFEENIENLNRQYKVNIQSYDTKRDITSQDLKFLMFPKKGLSGKAQQSIGGSIFARNTLELATKDADGSFNKEKEENETIYYVTLPEDNLYKFWRRRLLDTFFQSFNNPPELFSETLTKCSFCGELHKFRNLRFNPPINIIVENVTNYNSYLFNEPSFSICPYCSMLFMRTVVDQKGPDKIPFPKSKNAFIYILPFDPDREEVYEAFSKDKVERFLEKEIAKIHEIRIDALKYLLSLPIVIYKSLPLSISGKIKPSVYIIFAYKKQAEEVSNHFLITRFDYLAQVGRIIYEKGGEKEVNYFQQRLLSFVEKFSSDQKIHGYKLIFKFLGNMLTKGDIDFSFLHRVLRNEISLYNRESNKKHKKTFYLTGYKYLKAFLEAKKEVQYV